MSKRTSIYGAMVEESDRKFGVPQQLTTEEIVEEKYWDSVKDRNRNQPSEDRSGRFDFAR